MLVAYPGDSDEMLGIMWLKIRDFKSAYGTFTGGSLLIFLPCVLFLFFSLLRGGMYAK